MFFCRPLAPSGHPGGGASLSSAHYGALTPIASRRGLEQSMPPRDMVQPTGSVVITMTLGEDRRSGGLSDRKGLAPELRCLWCHFPKAQGGGADAEDSSICFGVGLFSWKCPGDRLAVPTICWHLSGLPCTPGQNQALRAPIGSAGALLSQARHS